MFNRKWTICFLLIAFVIILSVSVSAENYRARQLPDKPLKSSIPPGHDPRHIEVKFVDDLDIGLSEKGVPFDRRRSVLNSDKALAIIDEIAQTGGSWKRMTGKGESKMDEMRQVAQDFHQCEIADLNNYFILTVPEGESATEWMDRLNALYEVEIALAMPLPVTPPTPTNFEPLQGYLNAATDGIDAKYAWTLPGGTGSNALICDFEYSWNLNHYDLPTSIPTWYQTPYTPVDPFNDNNHGTSVLGELVSLNDGVGTTGASYGSSIGVAPTFLRPAVGDSAWLLGVAMTYVMNYYVNAGDVMLIEQQYPGPNYTGSSDTGLIPVEWWASWYNTILTATGNNIYVVEAAGNGYQNLDDPIYSTGHAPFQPLNHSGAIIVGAGAIPASFGGSTTDRSRLSFSNYGTRVDLQGWGEGVVTTGKGDYYNTDGVNYYYTNVFSGTSSASPNIASAVAIMSSINEAYNGSMSYIPIDRMIHILRVTGSPQTSGIHFPWEMIGLRPNLKSAISISGITDTMYFKQGYQDYCPAGMPDFSMHFDSSWMGYTRWTYDAPVALANCFWWFDSKFEPSPVDPRPFYPGGGTISDNYPLVQAYGSWDDHDTNNVVPLIEALAACMTTDDTMEVPGIYEYGTKIFEMESCVNTWLNSAGLRQDYTDTVVSCPDFDYLAGQLHDSQNIILLLGFYADTTDDCCRLGGHYVNLVGVDSIDRRIAIADGYTAYSTGLDLQNRGSHKDAGIVEYEMYQAAQLSDADCTVDGCWYLTDYYPDWMMMSFENINGPAQCMSLAPSYYAVIEDAMIICPTEEPALDTCTYYKTSYDDYAPNGVPDFDQKQPGWTSPYTGFYSWCGPVAVANCAWWFDSKYESSPVDPRPFYPGPGNPAPNDNYPLVQSFAPSGQWDDHDTNNVAPLMQHLKTICKTDAAVPGTYIGDLKDGVDTLISQAGLASDYATTLVEGPTFQQIKDSILASRDVILLLGFYEPSQPGGCVRLGGHYVTCAGVCEETDNICISDPFFDKNEGEPPSGTAHGPTVHNDADNVSGPHGGYHHDRYTAAAYSHACNTPAVTQLTDYPNNWTYLMNFSDQNWFNLGIPNAPYLGGQVVVLIDYALVVSPLTQECDCSPGDANGNGAFNILDVTYLINYLYKSGPAPYPYAICSGDANCNCAVNILDATYLINYLYKFGAPPCTCEQWLINCGEPLRK